MTSSGTAKPADTRGTHTRGRPGLHRLIAAVVLALACAQSAVAQDALTPEVAREQLAELELDFVVDRDLERTEAQLQRLLAGVLVGVSGPEDATDVEPLVAQLLARWAELLLDQGRLEEAELVLQASGTEQSMEFMRDSLGIPFEAVTGLADMSGALIAGAAKDGALGAQVARLAAMRRELTGGVSSEFVEAVREALYTGQSDTLMEFGLRALPAYEALTNLSQDIKSATTGSLGPGTTTSGNVRFDPLYWLLKLDADRGMSFLRRALDEDREMDVPRVAEMIRSAGVLYEQDLWFQSGDGQSRFLKPEYQALIVDLMAPKRFPAQDCRSLSRQVSEFMSRDALTEDLTAAIGDVFFRSDFAESDSLRSELLTGYIGRELFNARRSQTFQPLLEQLVVHPDDAVRLRAATSLVSHEHSDALLGRFADPNQQVRAEVARALGVRWVEPREGQQTQVHPRMEPADIAILERLAADGSKHVRLAAAQSLASHRLTVADEAVYLALARDSEPVVREAMTALVAGDLALRQRVLEVLAVDGDPRVRLAVAKRAGDPPELALALLEIFAADADSAVRKAILRSVTQLQRQERDLAVPLPLVERLVQDPDPGVRSLLPDLQVSGPEVMAALLMPLARDAYPEVLRRVDYRLDKQAYQPSWEGTDNWLLPVFQERLFSAESPYRSRLPHSTETSRRQLIRWALETRDNHFWSQFEREFGKSIWGDAFHGLEDHEVVELFTQAYARDPRRHSDVLRRLDDIASTGRTPRPEVGRLLFADESLPVPLRLMGAATYASVATSEEVDAWVGLLVDTDWSDTRLLYGSDGSLHQLGSTVPDAEHARFAQAVLSQGLPDTVIEPVMLGVAGRVHPDAETLRAILEWGYSSSGEERRSVRTAITALARVPEAVDPAWLSEAIFSPTYSDDAVRTMGALKDEQYTEVLGDYLTTAGLEGAHAPYWTHAREALVALMSDGAVEQLLRAAAWTTDSDARDSYMEGVATIQDYHDSLAAWEARKHRVATRDETVRELRALLDSKNALLRVEAVRGLGTLGAVDQLPALIRLLEDEDLRVVAAAQAALDLLNAEAAADVAAAADAAAESEKPSDG